MIAFVLFQQNINWRLPTEGRPQEDTGRKTQPTTGQGERPQKKPTLLEPCPWTSTLQNCEKIKSCRLSHPVCGSLKWFGWSLPSRQILTRKGSGRRNKKPLASRFKTPCVPAAAAKLLLLICTHAVGPEMPDENRCGAGDWEPLGLPLPHLFSDLKQAWLLGKMVDFWVMRWISSFCCCFPCYTLVIFKLSTWTLDSEKK